MMGLILFTESCKVSESHIWFPKVLYPQEVLKNIQATPTIQFQKNKRPNQEMGQRTKQTFLQRRHTDG